VKRASMAVRTAVAAGRLTLQVHDSFFMNAGSCTLNLGECVTGRGAGVQEGRCIVCCVCGADLVPERQMAWLR